MLGCDERGRVGVVRYAGGMAWGSGSRTGGIAWMLSV